MVASLVQRARVGRQILGAVLRDLATRPVDRAAKTPVFTVGCQRSGTTMLIKVLSTSPEIRVFGEDSKAAFSTGVRTRSALVLRALIGNSRESVVVFKPLNDTQNLDTLLALHPRARAIWAYRHYHDVINSMVEKWGDVQISAVRQIATGHYAGPGARALGERVNRDNLLLARKLHERNVSARDAAAFIWYLRNAIYFDLGLEGNSDVLLCKYEDLVLDPDHNFRSIFSFIGADFTTEYIAGVKSSSINKSEAPTLSDDIADLCENLLTRINGCYERQVENWPESQQETPAVVGT